MSNPIKLIWLAVNKGTGGAKPDFFEDMVHLFRQLMGKDRKTHSQQRDKLEPMDEQISFRTRSEDNKTQRGKQVTEY